MSRRSTERGHGVVVKPVPTRTAVARHDCTDGLPARSTQAASCIHGTGRITRAGTTSRGRRGSCFTTSRSKIARTEVADVETS